MGDADAGLPVDRLKATHPDQIHAALGRVLASGVFRACPRLASFLRFIVESEVAGRGGRLKGYTIGVEALGRLDDFDPQSDPIVRVEAGRLRSALGRYYSGEGAGDPLVIEVPRGQYVPRFHIRVESATTTRFARDWRRTFQAIRRFLSLRVTIQVQAAQVARDGLAAGKLAAPGPRLLPTAAIEQQASPSDGRKEQQAEGTAAARPR
jgi:hypothetical protein